MDNLEFTLAMAYSVSFMDSKYGCSLAKWFFKFARLLGWGADKNIVKSLGQASGFHGPFSPHRGQGKDFC